MSDSTLEYYSRNAVSFAEETFAVNMQPLYDEFLPLIPKGGKILDAGCGSGRDALAFKNLGYRVEAFDACAELANIASFHLEQPVGCFSFDELRDLNTYDAIWCCASLLHVPMAELPAVFQRLQKALKSEGIIYISFKYGEGERTTGGRAFTDLTEQSLNTLLAQHTGLKACKTWQTGDQRPGREHERWLNALLERVSGE
ncbi:class I SAM-dependent methyltransferase [Pseudoalteromonas sp. PPB1]|uniref:class I SAM-dependent methyltransferase n=1 Tax=Pseudoalteromonas sp. PPB1 TaxID=2756136 RepID=UPI001891980D|nr:class I SAM-dependent methyltransferase [Pseudoalteromonas sp. PPB1]